MLPQFTIAQLKAGDERAFRAMVATYKADIATVVINILGRGPMSEDIGQEVFIRFYKARKKFRGDAELKTYLIRIAINLCRNELGKKKRTQVEPDDNLPAESNNWEAKQRLEEALKRLSSEQKEVVILRHIEGLDTKETSEALGIPEGTVMSRLKRAQEKLKKLLVQ